MACISTVSNSGYFKKDGDINLYHWNNKRLTNVQEYFGDKKEEEDLAATLFRNIDLYYS